MNYRATINDNMLVVVMIETLEGVANANEIASTFAWTSSFRGTTICRRSPGGRRTTTAIRIADQNTRRGAPGGQVLGNAGAQFLTGNRSAPIHGSFKRTGSGLLDTSSAWSRP